MLARLIATALLVTATGLFITTAPTPADAKQCKEKRVKGNSNAVPALKLNKTVAKNHAVMAWTKRCNQLYPGVWCDPQMAKNRKTVCNRKPTGVGTFLDVCEHEGKPCRN